MIHKGFEIPAFAGMTRWASYFNPDYAKKSQNIVQVLVFCGYDILSNSGY
jgi:hypothetical protein